MKPAQFALMAIALATAACATAPGGSSASGAWLDNAQFSSMGQGTGAFSATLNGSTNAAAPYTIRVHITKGGRIMPHTHPDERVITVVDGELCYGFGSEFDPDGCKLYPEGSYFVVPANAPHYGFGKTGDAVYQESGVGPSAFVRLPASAN
jgi:quercetin dioxygenase-like cupin family protein